MSKLSKIKKIELVGFYVYCVLVVFAALTLHFDLNLMVVFYMLLPALYFTLRSGQFKKNLLETLVFAVPVGLIVDFIARMSRSWNDSPTIFATRILGVVTIEILLWGVFYTFLVVSMYKYFFDSCVARKFSQNVKRYFLILGLAVGTFVLLNLLRFNFYLPYFYLGLNIAWLLILIVGLYRFPALTLRTLLAAIYFFPFSLMHELTSLHLGHWFFEKGNHVGYITLLGQYEFPVEELLWFIFVIPTMIVLHEYFADNRK